jgi:hypothetical protein
VFQRKDVQSKLWVLIGRSEQEKPLDVLNSIRLGMTREEVVATLGIPDDVSTPSRRDRLPAIYKYGDIELYFGPGKVGKLWMAYTEVETEDGERRGEVLLK